MSPASAWARPTLPRRAFSMARATTHWAAADDLQRRWPKVDWQPGLFVTEIQPSPAAAALLPRRTSRSISSKNSAATKVAVQTAKALLLTMPRTHQSGYAVLPCSSRRTPTTRSAPWRPSSRSTTPRAIERGAGRSRLPCRSGLPAPLLGRDGQGAAALPPSRARRSRRARSLSARPPDPDRLGSRGLSGCQFLPRPLQARNRHDPRRIPHAVCSLLRPRTGNVDLSAVH